MPEDLPLALRRPRRSMSGARHQPARAVSQQPPQTPSRGKKKRVRFSDPGPTTQDVEEDSTAAASTGLTPSMRRTTLAPGSGGSKRRRHSGPPAAAAVAGTKAGSQDVVHPGPDRDTGYDGQVTFLPLRQVLDGRVKRRIRRNGLSEEMNVISAERRRRWQQTSAEVDALRAEVAAKDAEIRRLSGATEVADADADESIEDLKRQVDHLRRALQSPAPSHATTEDGCDASSSCTRVGDEHSGDCLEMHVDLDVDDEDVEDHFFGDDTLAELACSTPSRRPADFRNSFPTPPSTSPLARLATPLFRRTATPPTTSHAAVQADVPGAGRAELEGELASLHLEIDRLTGTLEAYEAMTSRLADKLARLAPDGGGSAAEAILGSRSPAVRVEAQLHRLLGALSDRTAALSEVGRALGRLGFAGDADADADADDAPGAVAALAAAFRSARLELEYLEPGESALPLAAPGAAVLDLLLARLRELARRGREADEAAGAHRAREARLRRELAARAGAADDLRREAGALRAGARRRDARAAELEAGMARLRATVRSYTRDVAELEALARRLEGDLDAAGRYLRRARGDAAGALGARDATIARLGERLDVALAQTAELRDQLAGLQGRHEEELEALRGRHGAEMAAGDARASELRREMDGMEEALREAREAVQGLRAERGTLDGQLEAERRRARAVFDAMKADLDRAVRLGERLMASTPPKSP